MILLADSGSTKTEWRLISGNGSVSVFKTIGLNPFFVTADEAGKIIDRKFLKIDKSVVQKVFFYGAGCTDEKQCEVINSAIRSNFKNAVIDVQSDLLGAARALFGEEKGIAAILGTGSNSGVYDGKTIVENVLSLGYILGDEGSGSFLGKKFITALLRNELPVTIRKQFYKEYDLNKEQILNAVYREPFPNRWMAQFSVFIKKKSSDAFIKNMVEKSFKAFFENQVSVYKECSDFPIGFVGSVASNFSEELKKIAAEYNFEISRMLNSPVEALVSFHLKQK
ncbi:MAG: ATPase [Bacteroidia bacterium]|nr:ATPase [Bacteroidia bacterium]